jgi:acyl carrier protein
MTRPEIHNAVTQVFRQVLDDDTNVLVADTTAEDVEDWDSMNHLFIVVELEKQFSLQFKAVEMEELKNAGALVSQPRQKPDGKD